MIYVSFFLFWEASVQKQSTMLSREASGETVQQKPNRLASSAVCSPIQTAWNFWGESCGQDDTNPRTVEALVKAT